MTATGWGPRRRRGPQPPDVDVLAELDARALTIERQSQRIHRLLDERDALIARLESSEVARTLAEQAAQLAQRQAIAGQWNERLQQLDAEAPNVTPEPVYRSPLDGTVPSSVDADELAAKLRAAGVNESCSHSMRRVNGAGVATCLSCGAVLDNDAAKRRA